MDDNTDSDNELLGIEDFNENYLDNFYNNSYSYSNFSFDDFNSHNFDNNPYFFQESNSHFYDYKNKKPYSENFSHEVSVLNSKNELKNCKPYPSDFRDEISVLNSKNQAKNIKIKKNNQELYDNCDPRNNNLSLNNNYNFMPKNNYYNTPSNYYNNLPNNKLSNNNYKKLSSNNYSSFKKNYYNSNINNNQTFKSKNLQNKKKINSSEQKNSNSQFLLPDDQIFDQKDALNFTKTFDKKEKNNLVKKDGYNRRKYEVKKLNNSKNQKIQKYQKLKKINNIKGYVVNIHDAINFDIDLDLDNNLKQKYKNVIQNKYSYKKLNQNIIFNLDLEQINYLNLIKSNTYRCRLRGIGINQYSKNNFNNTNHQNYIMTILVKKIINMSNGWIICHLTDIDIYQRLLIDIYIPNMNINLSSFLLNQMKKYEDPIFYEYNSKK